MECYSHILVIEVIKMRVLSVAVVVLLLASYMDAYKVVCYFESWAVYRPGNGKFDVEDIDPQLCTHLIYSFMGISTDGQVTILDSWNEIDKGAIKRFNNLRQKNPNLKTMAAIGGASASTATFAQVINNAGSRSTFANNIIAFMQKYGFDGFDLDWEYPTNKAAFSELLKILRPKFDAHGYLLSAAVSAGKEHIDASYDVPALGKYLDFINVMAYDLHGSWDPVTGENAPLYAGAADKSDFQRQLNVDYAIKYWQQLGAPKNKLVLGMGTYGRTFTLSNPSNNGVGVSASGGGQAGPYTQASGYLGYNEICEKSKAGGWSRKWNDEQKVVYAVNGNQWVGYDDVDSVKIKAQYIKDHGLGGAMFWTIDTDDFRNICGSGKFPLINAVKSILK